jgi:hypothetical protein
LEIRFWLDYPEFASPDNPFVPNFYRLGSKLAQWIQKKVESLFEKFKQSDKIPDERDGSVLQKARVDGKQNVGA